MVGLIILDGFGLSDNNKGNAVKIANPKNINGYMKDYSFTTLQASGESVGLPSGQMGNSEVGHLNIGAGNIVYQSLLKINNAIKDKSFFSNASFIDACNQTKQNNSKLHIMGLLSDGGVHSHINHLFAIIDLVKQQQVKNVYLHLFLDGRDTYRTDGIKYIKMVEKYIKGSDIAIASVMGRYYAMDREKNYDITKIAYDCIVNLQAKQITDIDEYILDCYKNEIYDEFIKPAIINKNGNIDENDSVIYFNYRQDRARQLTAALTQPFDQFEVKQFKNVKFVSMTCYDENFKNINVAFDNEIVKNNLSYVVSKNNLKQFKLTETTKYAHVTYFLNGGIEKPNENEDRFLIDTIKNTPFDKVPAMRAVEITDKAIQLIEQNKYDFYVINYSNCDMIGHTGNLQAAVDCIKIIDEQLKRLIDKTLQADGECVIIADHGNCEQMLDENDNILTDHTTNLVPCIIISKNKYKLKKGKLSNVAPTILKLLNIEKPSEWEQESLF